MLFLDGVYAEQANGRLRFHQTKAPTEKELDQLTHTLAHRVGRYLERQGLLERDVENSYQMADELDSGPMAQLQGASITYRVAIGSQQGRKLFTLQTLPVTRVIRTLDRIAVWRGYTVELAKRTLLF